MLRLRNLLAAPAKVAMAALVLVLMLPAPSLAFSQDIYLDATVYGSPFWCYPSYSLSLPQGTYKVYPIGGDWPYYSVDAMHVEWDLENGWVVFETGSNSDQADWDRGREYTDNLEQTQVISFGDPSWYHCDDPDEWRSVPPDTVRLSTALWDLSYGYGGISLRVESLEASPWDVSWQWPEVPEAQMHRPYEARLTVRNVTSEPLDFGYGLSADRIYSDPYETPVQPDWDLGEGATVLLDRATPNARTYQLDTVLEESIPAGATREHTFLISNAWKWIPPWDPGRVVSAATTVLPEITPEVRPLLETEAGAVPALQGLGESIPSAPRLDVTYRELSDSDVSPRAMMVWVPLQKVQALYSSLWGARLGAALVAGGLASRRTNAVAGEAVAAEGGIMLGQSEVTYARAVTPREDFTRSADLPVLVDPVLSSLPSSPTRTAGELVSRLYAVSEATSKSYARYLAATSAGEDHWAAAQLAATRTLMSQAVADMKQLGRTVRQVASRIQPPGPDEIAAIRAQLNTEGLPAALSAELRQVGWSQEAIDELKETIVSSDDAFFGSFTDVPAATEDVLFGLQTCLAGLPEPPPDSLTAQVAIEPAVLQPQSADRWITCYVQLPPGHSPTDIDVSSIRLNGTVSAAASPVATKDRNRDRVPELAVKFSRAQAMAALGQGQQTALVAGALSDGTPFGGAVMVEVVVSRPTGPQRVCARASSATQVNLCWVDAASNETGYIVERAEGSGSRVLFLEIARLGANATSFSDTVARDHKYSYRVWAYNAGGLSPRSNVAVVSMPTAPRAPSGLRVGAVTCISVSVSWGNMAADAQGFYIERSSDGGATWTRVGQIPACVPLPAYVDLGLERQTTYWYRVQAFNSYGTSAYSNVVSATTK